MYNAVPPPASVAFKASDDATTNTIQLPASTPKTKITLKSTTLKQKLAYTKLQELKNKRDKICKSLKIEEKKEQKNFWKKRNLFMNKCKFQFHFNFLMLLNSIMNIDNLYFNIYFCLFSVIYY
jgi:hypothetical protein